MKSVSGLIIAALLLAGLGTMTYAASRADGHLADAQEQTATQRYDEAAESLDAAEECLFYARWLPWIGGEPLREVAARRAALRYWRGDFEALLPEGDPVASVDESNVPLQFVVANAVFRDNLAKATAAPSGNPAMDRTALLQALDEAASGYMTVLKSQRFYADASFNYEYLVSLREEAAKGRRPPQQPGQSADMGESGAPSPAPATQQFEIYIPLESNEKAPEGGDAGKVTAKERKG
jgi:hypothetical protein